MPRGSFVAQTSSSIPASNSGPASNSSVSLDTEDENAMMHYVGIERKSKNPVKRALLKNFTPRGLLEKLLRKTLKRNTWIYVSVSAHLKNHAASTTLTNHLLLGQELYVPDWIRHTSSGCLTSVLLVNIYIGIKGV